MGHRAIVPWRARLTLLAVLLGMSLPAPSALAFCRLTTCDGDCKTDADGCKAEGKPLRWVGPCVGMSLQRDGGGKLPRKAVVFAVDRALEAWVTTCQEEGGASMTFTSYKTTTCSRPIYNREGPNANAIIFRDGGAWAHDNELGNTLGYTTVSYNVGSGEIYGADIELNNTSGQLGVPGSPGEYDLRSVITHELGHVLGMGHTQDENAVMYPSLPTSENRHALRDDDRSAMCEVYAPDRKTGKCVVAPRGGFTDDCTERAAPAVAGEPASCAISGSSLARDRGDRSDAFLGLGAVMALSLTTRRGRRGA